jgi:DNA-binding NtrC family response regulator
MANSLSGRRVFVVEDEMLVAWLMEDMLVELGCVVIGPAVRVDEALRMIETSAIDLAVVDVNLNGERSFPVADALAERGVPFAFSTGYHIDSLPAQYRGFPMLRKPFARSKLSETLSGLLISKEPNAAEPPEALQ